MLVYIFQVFILYNFIYQAVSHTQKGNTVMNKQLLFIINPCAGKKKAQKMLYDLIDIFSLGGYEVTVFPTRQRDDATNIIKTHSSCDIVVCCGGDGTLSETVNGIARLKKIIPMGFIPAGTTNDFAATLDIPFDLAAAAKNIVLGKDYLIDIGFFSGNVHNGRYFSYIAAFGLFTSVSYVVPQEMKNTLGHFAYMLEGIKQALEMPSYRLLIEYDGNIIEDEFVLGTITNSTSVAGLLKFNKEDICLDDGEFEVMLVRKTLSDMQLKMAIWGLAIQQYDERCVMYFRASKIKISSVDAEPIAWCIDGEDGGTHSEAEISNLQKRIAIRF